MNKKTVRLSESQLHRIIKESVNNVLEGKKKKDPMSQWFKDMDDIQKHRDNMEYITKGGRKPKHWKKDDEGMNEGYNSANELQRLAYENQGMRRKIQEVADFADYVAEIAKMQNKENYYDFYSKLRSDILQMHNLWNFLDDED